MRQLRTLQELLRDPLQLLRLLLGNQPGLPSPLYLLHLTALELTVLAVLLQERLLAVVDLLFVDLTDVLE